MRWLRLVTVAAVVAVVAVSLWCGQEVASARPVVSVAPSDPTVVRILSGGHLQVSSPDDRSDIEVSGGSGGSVIVVSDFSHGIVGVDPCVRPSSLNIVQCPIQGLTSVTVLTGAGDDLVQMFTDLPVLVATSAGNDVVRDVLSRDALVLLGDGDDEAESGDGPPTFSAATASTPSPTATSTPTGALGWRSAWTTSPTTVGRVRTTTSTPTWRTSSDPRPLTC